MVKESLSQPSRELVTTDVSMPDIARGEGGWGFAISFVGGHGVLSTRDRHVGPLGVKSMALEVPNLAFPFDLSGGAEIFRSRRCMLRQLVLTLDNARLLELVQSANLGAHGLFDLRVAICDGFVELAGVFRVGEQSADFTCRAALMPSGPHTLQLVFYETRFFGWLPVPAALLPVCLQRAFHFDATDGPMPAGAWSMRPVETCARQIMPRGGWKIPDLRKSHLLSVQVSRGELTIAAGPGEENWDLQLVDRPPPPAAVRAARGILKFTAAEEALAAGAVGEAYQMFRRGLDDPQDGAWARERLLQIGTADPELVMETRRLAEEVLAHNPDDVTARLSLGALCLRGRAYEEAVEHYNGLAELLGARKERFDTVAAEMASGRAAAFTNPAAALRAFERAASRVHDNATVQAHIYALHESTGDFAEAAEAGERWIELVNQPQARASTRCRLAHLYLTRLQQTERAREHFLAALREVPHMPEALEGLAETHIARDEPEQASAFLEAMAEQAETCEDKDRIALLNMRLGEVSRRWLKDPAAAAARYRRVLDVEPRHVQAALRLAELCEADDDLAQATELYRGVIAAQDDMVVGDKQDLLTAHLRLAHLYDAQSPNKVAQVIAQLERALELDPANAEARNKLLAMLRQSGDWSPLVARLEDIVRQQIDPVTVRAARLEAADIELNRREHLVAARQLLEPLLDAEPAALDALELFSEVCKRQNDPGALTGRLSQAIAAVPRSDAAARAHLMYRLGMAQKEQGSDVTLCRQSFEAALLLDPQHSAAAHTLVAVLQRAGDATALARAYRQLADTHSDSELKAKAYLAAAQVLGSLPEQSGAALAAVEAALEADPTLLDARLMQAELLAGIDPDGAINVLEEALKHFSGEAAVSLHSRLAILCQATGDSVAQVEHLEAVDQAGALDTDQHHAFVDALVVLGQEGRAASLWERLSTRQSDPEARAKALLQAAALQISAGHKTAARDLLAQVCAVGGALGANAAHQIEDLALLDNDLDGVAQALVLQIQYATPAAQLAPYQRLLELHLQCGNMEEAGRLSTELLERSPQNALARHTLAQVAAAQGAWEEALDHFVYLTLVSPKHTLPAATRQSAYHSAAALAQEIRDNALPALQEGYLAEFGRALEALPMSEMLAAENAWEALLALRCLLLESRDAEARVTLQRQIADMLHKQL